MSELQPENTRTKIMECGLRLFSEKGYDGVGVQQIAEESGITKPTLYYFFGNKEGLYKAIWKEYFSILDEKLSINGIYKPNPQIYEEDVFPQLCNIANIFKIFANKYSSFYKLYMSNLFVPFSSSEGSMIYEYIKRPKQIMEVFFEDASKVHGNMIGREKLFAWSFLSLVQIAALEKDEISSENLVKQFMHGIFS